MQDHTKLRVWQHAHELTVVLFKATQRSSFRRVASLGGQLRRAMSSVGANIAEGAAQESPAQFARFLTVALASANEVANHIQLAKDLDALPAEEAESVLVELGRIRAMIIVLQRRVRERESLYANPSRNRTT